LQESCPASEAVSFCAEAFGVAAFAVDVAVGRVAAKDGIQRPFAVSAGKTFLCKKIGLDNRKNFLFTIKSSLLWT
jgi:hypothetical protein